ncbi:acetate uptake transporter [Lutibacter oricola]
MFELYKNEQLNTMSTTKLGNPAVVGLAGFGLTTLLLQFHNLGFIGLGPVVSMGFIFGGLAQMIAGFLEQKMGNNFGFAAFVSYGAFWIGLGIIWMLNNSGVYVSSHTDVGFYLVAWTLLTFIFWVGSLFIHTAMAFTFTTLLVGFILLDLAHFGFPELTTLAAYDLIVCALAAWYMMGATIINDVAGKALLKVGKPWVNLKNNENVSSKAKLSTQS